MIGSTVGPYQILDKLGVGGMGEVFLGHDPRLQRRVALKCLAAAPGGVVGDRILREARAAARLNHPNIAAVYDVLEQGDRTFIVMEYVEGESLAARLRRGAPSIAEIRGVGRQLASALAAAHAQGVVHRDLKPANVMMARDGSIKVLDFGVAKLSALVAGTEDATGHVMPESTLAGNPGTPVYMSPEQLFDRPIDGRSDLYSAGAILYEMATGRRPYTESGAAALAVAMSKAPPPSPRSIVPSIPPDLESVIMRAVERDPDRRYQSARELEEALGVTSSNTDGSQQWPSGSAGAARDGRRRRILVWAFAVVAIAAVGIALREPLLRGLRPTAQPSRRVVVAILPVDNPTGDLRAESLGTGLTRAIANNFGSIPGVTILPRSSTLRYAKQRTAVAAIGGELGASDIVDLTIRATSPHVILDLRLRHADNGPASLDRALEGNVLTVERQLLDELGRAFERTLKRTFDQSEWSRIRLLPTSNADALEAYVEGRALIDRYDVPGNVDRAVALLTRATELDPRFAVAYATLGDALWRRYQSIDKRPEVANAATASVMKALEVDPNIAPVYYSVANMQYQTGRYQESLRSLRHALELQPDHDETHRLLGRVLSLTGDVDGGIAELHRAIELQPDWFSYYNLGYALYAHSQYREAIDAFNKTIELQPTFPDGFQMLGTTYHMLGDPAQAIGNYEHAARLGPNANAYANLALAYYTAARYDEARVAYVEAIKHDGRKASFRRDLADVDSRLGRNAEARASYEKAIELSLEDLKVNSTDGHSVAVVALCEAKIGRKAAAERHAAEALVLAPSNRDVRTLIVKAYAALNDRTAGLNALKDAVALGWEPKMIREDDELSALRSGPEFEAAIASGLAARAQQQNSKKEKR